MSGAKAARSGAVALTPSDPASPEHQDDRADRSSDAAKSGLGHTEGNQSRFKPRPEVMRLIGLGTELAGFTLVTMAVGYAVDAARGHETRYVTALGALIGFTLGMTRFILRVRSLSDD